MKTLVKALVGWAARLSRLEECSVFARRPDQTGELLVNNQSIPL
jgi:hypothetical protein